MGKTELYKEPQEHTGHLPNVILLGKKKNIKKTKDPTSINYIRENPEQLYSFSGDLSSFGVQ